MREPTEFEREYDPIIESLLADVAKRGFRLLVTIDPKRDGFSEDVANDPAVQVLRAALAHHSSGVIGLLVVRGRKDGRWLERLAGSTATTRVARDEA